MTRSLLPLVVLVTITAAAFLSRADEPDPKVVSTDDLIARLGSAEFTEREQASKALQTRGPSVLPALRKALKDKDAEIRRRVGELIPILEVVAAVAPKRVTLSGEKQPLAAILKEIGIQTGYSVRNEEGDGKKQFAIEMKDMPFWEALERIRLETGYLVDTKHNLREGLVLKRSKGSPFICIADSFRLKLSGIHEDRDANFDEAAPDGELGRRSHLLRLSISMIAEPRLLFLEVGIPQAPTAVDDFDKPFKFPSPTKKSQVEQQRQYGSYLYDYEQVVDIHLERSSKKTQTIKELRGTIPIQVVTARNPVVVTNKFLESKGTKFQIGGDKLEIKTAKMGEKEGRYQLQIEVPVGPKTISQSWDHRIHLEDANGNRYRYCIQACNPPNCWMDYDGPRDNPGFGPPVRIVVEDWTIVQYSIPFVFKDVPLP